MSYLKTRPDAIYLKGQANLWNSSEANAAAAINPGYIVELTGTVNVQAQSVAKANAAVLIATEDLIRGKTIDDAYAADDRVYFVACQSGDEVQGKVAAGAGALVRGDQVELAGDGTVQLLTDGWPIGTVLVDLDNSAGADEAFLIFQVK